VRAQVERGAVDVDRHRAFDHPEVVLQTLDRRRLEGDGRAGGHVHFHELAAQAGRRRRHHPSAVVALGVRPLGLLRRAYELRRPGLGVGHQARQRPAVGAAQGAEHGGGGTQLGSLDPRQRRAADAGTVGQVVEGPAAIGAQLCEPLRDSAVDVLLNCRCWARG